MSKLSELAELLKSAKTNTVTASVPPPVEVAVVVEEAPVAPLVTKPAEPPPPPSVVISMLQKDMLNLKRMVEEKARYNQPSLYMGSGGGADSTANIDRPTTYITTNYTATLRDWYIGVGPRNDIITIMLPAVKNGREYVIKDEAGIAELVPIRVAATIDNDPEGVELRINNGSITLLYHNGWRII